jgi:hypothetical protein
LGNDVREGDMFDQKNTVGREGYILVEALTFTIEALGVLPAEFPADNNITEMRRILDGLLKQDANFGRSQWLARHKLDRVLTHSRPRI